MPRYPQSTRCYALCLVFPSLLLIGGQTSGFAQEKKIIAEFTAGGSLAQAMNRQIDGFRGTAGDGWLGPWSYRGYPGAAAAESVAVVPTENGWDSLRLRITPSKGRGGTGVSVARAYDFTYLQGSGKVSDRVIITFQLFIDDLGDFLASTSNHFFIGENGPTASANRTSVTSWCIQAFGGEAAGTPLNDHSAVGTSKGATEGEWNFGDGKDFISSGVPLIHGSAYTFVIIISPDTHTYTVRVSDGIREFQSDPLRFLHKEPLGRTLVFGQKYTPNQGAQFSLARISISATP